MFREAEFGKGDGVSKSLGVTLLAIFALEVSYSFNGEAFFFGVGVLSVKHDWATLRSYISAVEGLIPLKPGVLRDSV